MIRILTVAGLLTACMYGVPSFAQNTSNKGKDFWLGFGNHQRGYNTNTQELVLYITSDVNTQGRIEVPGIGHSQDFNVTANSIQTITVPKAAYLQDEGQYNTGIHITSERPVVVYAHIYDLNVSGATLVLPTNVLGKEYYSINYKQVSNQDTAFSFFFVVAVEDGTEVDITPSANTKGGWKAGETHRVNLNKGQIYQVLGESLGAEQVGLDSRGRPVYNYNGVDLSGSKIRSVSTGTADCKRIAVFSGSGKIGIGGCPPNNIGSSDNLFQQVYPTTGWGKKTITVPLASRNYDMIRIVKSDPAAIVTLNGMRVADNQFVNGFYYEFASQQVNVIESNLPVQVVQYAVSQGWGINCTEYNEQNGDPEMIFLNAVEQNIDHITVYSAGAYRIRRQFINVVIETDAVAGFTLDGVPQETQFRPVPGDASYSYAQLTVTEGVHTLSAAKGFNAIAYGFGNAESYGYSAGTNVKEQDLKARNEQMQKLVSSGCINEPLRFSIGLQYEVKKLTWDPGNGISPLSYDNVRYDSIYTENGKTYYAYSLKENITYDTAGDYEINITAEKLSADGCGNTNLISVEFSVYAPPLPEFSLETACEATAVQFTDKSNGNGRDINTWLWDFGDGNTSAEQHPLHTYSEGGEYQVTLTVTSDSGCSPVISDPFTVKVYKKPVAGFTTAGDCQGQIVVFKDQSTSAAGEGTIIRWIWDYGDGSADTLENNQEWEHIYPLAGTYPTRLTVITDKGCQQTAAVDLLIRPVPVAAFSLPDVCLEDAWAEFSDRSVMTDGSDGGFTYEWDFGDSSPVVSSAEKNVRHKYHDTGIYQVRLITQSAAGCRDTIIQALTVNGSHPKAAFDVLDETSLCSNRDVVFINRSTVDFGHITRLEWSFDDGRDPAKTIVDEEPEPGKAQPFKYPEFHLPATMEYTVRLKAYSGGVCVDESTRNITLKALPEVSFAATGPLCQEENSVRLSVTEITGFGITGEFKGPGTSASGVFSPGKAGPGTHTIHYIFSGPNGCPDTVSQDILVYPTPTVSGEDVFMREGTFVRLSVTTDPDIVRYEWFPSDGLNRSDVPDPVASPFDNTVYTLQVTNANGCKGITRIRVNVEKYPIIPNAFSPNGDGNNDTWVVKYLDRYPDCRVEIFSRYGNRVFVSDGYSASWDGTYNGSPLPVGVYYYLITLKNGMGPYKGSVSIIK